jgi:hypothetical protein
LEAVDKERQLAWGDPLKIILFGNTSARFWLSIYISLVPMRLAKSMSKLSVGKGVK